ncbi:hypothetical protein [Mesorhizobium sp. Cs1321R2N1]|uniref:hypothetical protein n=1 Tax=Mesorhizobium sp. Cs1321R2N1 TaxID=3015174 RepID=UPI00301D04E5
MTPRRRVSPPQIDPAEIRTAAGTWFGPVTMMATAEHSKAYRKRQRSGALACNVEVPLHVREWLIESGRLAEASGNDPARVAGAVERLILETFRHAVTQRPAEPK